MKSSRETKDINAGDSINCYLRTFTEQTRKDIHTMNMQLSILEQSIKVKDRLIGYLNKELSSKNDVVARQFNAIQDFQVNVGMFYRVLHELKDAKTREDIKTVLSTYQIDLDELPAIH